MIIDQLELDEFPVVNPAPPETQRNAGTQTESEPSHVSPNGGAVVLENNNNNQDGSSRPKNFDDLLEKYVGSWGPFQLKISMLLCLVLQQGAAPLRNNMVYILDVPNHWCNVPGQPENLTLEAWKNITVPWELGPDGRMRHSQCEMYGLSSGNVTLCTKWDYDKTHYSITIPTQNNWVCEQKHYNFRSPWKETSIHFIVCSLPSLVSSSLKITGGLGLSFIRGLSGGSIFEMSSLIATEQCGPAHRSKINTWKWISSVVGNIVNVLLVMYLQDWHLFGWATSGIGFIGVFMWPLLPESARWLISRGKSKEAIKVLAKMAKANGKDGNTDVISGDVNYLVEENKKIQKVSLGTVFLRGRLCFNFVMLTICITMSAYVSDLTYLNAPRMSGYKFLNVIILFLAELVGGTIGGYFMDTLGRRWTQTLSNLMSAAGGLFCAFAVPYMGYWELLGGAFFIKIGEAIASLAASTIRDEVLPTSIRSTASGIALFIAAVVGILVPDVVELGNDNASFPYESICIAGILGAFAAMMLPETLHQRLPETIDEANNFSTKGRFWNFRPATTSYNDESR